LEVGLQLLFLEGSDGLSVVIVAHLQEPHHTGTRVFRP
jgi:hypothetical protein